MCSRRTHDKTKRETENQQNSFKKLEIPINKNNETTVNIFI